jgi:hypothetical protein
MDFKKISELNNLELINFAETFAAELRANRKEIASSNKCGWIDDSYWVINALFDRIGELNEERYEMEAIINHQVKQAIDLSVIKSKGNA